MQRSRSRQAKNIKGIRKLVPKTHPMPVWEEADHSHSMPQHQFGRGSAGVSPVLGRLHAENQNAGVGVADQDPPLSLARGLWEGSPTEGRPTT